MSTAAMLLAAANCAHSCGPDLDPNGSDPGPEPPAYARCAGAHEGAECRTRLQALCETRDHPIAACNRTLSCDGAGLQRWSSVPPTKTDCTRECPATFTDRLANGCVGANADTLVCEYVEGTCGCAKTDGSAFEWKCVKPAPGCPALRPAIGGECLDAITCDYGASIFPNGARMRCHYETWRAD